MDKARHSSASVEHYTPEYIIEAARTVLGDIDLDPASCDEAQQYVKAERFFKEADDGLAWEWFGRVFLNPPGGRINGKSSQKVWWAKLAREFVCRRTEAAVFVGFSIEMLQTTQNGLDWPIPAASTFCIPKKRIAYRRPGGAVGSAPPHASVIVYLGEDQDVFRDVFSEIGRVIVQ